MPEKNKVGGKAIGFVPNRDYIFEKGSNQNINNPQETWGMRDRDGNFMPFVDLSSWVFTLSDSANITTTKGVIPLPAGTEVTFRKPRMGKGLEIFVTYNTAGHYIKPQAVGNKAFKFVRKAQQTHLPGTKGDRPKTSKKLK